MGVASSRFFPKSLHYNLAWQLLRGFGNELSGRSIAVRAKAFRKGKPECGDDLGDRPALQVTLRCRVRFPGLTGLRSSTTNRPSSRASSVSLGTIAASDLTNAESPGLGQVTRESSDNRPQSHLEKGGWRGQQWKRVWPRRRYRPHPR